MLELTHIMKKEEVTDIYNSIFGNDQEATDCMIVALLNDKTIIGLALLNMYNDGVMLKRLGILKEHRKKGNGDFFTRALFYMLTVSGNPFYINYYDKFYEKFGFERYEKNKMMANSIVYPSNCGGH